MDAFIFSLYKLNVEGAIFKDKKEAGVGVVIRDHVGNFIASLSKKLRCPLGAIAIEARALNLVWNLPRIWVFRTLF